MAIPASVLRRVDITEAPELFEQVVTEALTTVLGERYRTDPATSLTAAERDALRRGGMELAPVAWGREDPLLRTAAEYAVLVASAYTVGEVAELLRVEPSRIRQRLGARTLYGVKERGNWRIYFQGTGYPAGWASFRHYGPLLSARFDHHLPPSREQARGILYAPTAIRTCVAEVFQENRLIDTHDRLPWLVGFRLRRAGSLLDLTGHWPTAAGASALIHAGRRDRARAWSRAMDDAYPHGEGLHYCSSMNANQSAVALYERAADSIDPSPTFHRELADPSLLDPLRRIAVELGYGLT